MQEVIEELKSRAESTAFPLSLPELEDVVEAQEAMLIDIPAEMREYLLQCSDVIYGSLEPVTLADPMSHTFLPEVAAEAWAEGLPRELLPLCQHEGGYYAVSDDGTVWTWSPSEDEPEECADGVWAWVRDVWLAQ